MYTTTYTNRFQPLTENMLHTVFIGFLLFRWYECLKQVEAPQFAHNTPKNCSTEQKVNSNFFWNTRYLGLFMLLGRNHETQWMHEWLIFESCSKKILKLSVEVGHFREGWELHSLSTLGLSLAKLFYRTNS